MTVEHVPASAVNAAPASALRAVSGAAETTDHGASIVCVAADALPGSKDATPKNVHCSGYNVWA